MESRPRPKTGKRRSKGPRPPQSAQPPPIEQMQPSTSTASTLDIMSESALNLINPIYSMIATEANIVGHVLSGLGNSTAGMLFGMNLDLFRNRLKLTNGPTSSKSGPEINIDEIDDDIPIDQKGTPTLHQGFKNRLSFAEDSSERIENDLESLYSEGSRENAILDLTKDQIKSRLDRISYLKTKYSHKIELIEDDIKSLVLKKEKIMIKLNNLKEKETELIDLSNSYNTNDLNQLETIVETGAKKESIIQTINDKVQVEINAKVEISAETESKTDLSHPEIKDIEVEKVEITAHAEPIDRQDLPEAEQINPNESKAETEIEPISKAEEEPQDNQIAEEVSAVEDSSLPEEPIEELIIPKWGSFIKSFEPHPNHSITALDIDPQSNFIVSGATDSSIKLWDANQGSSIATLIGQKQRVHCLKSDHGLVVSGGQDTNIYIHNVNNIESGLTSDFMDPSMTLTEHASPVSALDFNQTTLVSGCEDGTMIHWDLETGKSLSLMDTVWNMNTGLVKDFKNKYSKVTNGRGSDYDSLNSTIGSLMVWKHALASGTIDGVIRMWDIRTGQSHRSLSDHLGPITSLQFDQTTIVSSSLDKTIRIWDLRMGKVVEKLSLNHPVLKVQFDKQMIVGVVDEYELPYVYNRVTFQPQQLEVPPSPVTTIDESEAFIAKMNGADPIKESGPTRYFSSKFTRSSPMGSVGWLASGTRSGSVNIWSI